MDQTFGLFSLKTHKKTHNMFRLDHHHIHLPMKQVIWQQSQQQEAHVEHHTSTYMMPNKIKTALYKTSIN